MYGSLFFHGCLDDSRVEIGRSSLFQWQWLWRILESARAGLPESSLARFVFDGSWESNLNKFSRYHPTAPTSDGTSAQVLFTMFLVPSRQHPRPKQRLLVVHVASRACRRWSNLKDPADADWERLSPSSKSIVDEAMWLDTGSRAGRTINDSIQTSSSRRVFVRQDPGVGSISNFRMCALFHISSFPWYRPRWLSKRRYAHSQISTYLHTRRTGTRLRGKHWICHPNSKSKVDQFLTLSIVFRSILSPESVS